jgi:hypothetical protein
VGEALLTGAILLLLSSIAAAQVPIDAGLTARARDPEQRAWETGVLPHSRGGNPKPMFLFRRIALLLALCLPAANVFFAQSSSSNPVSDERLAESSSSNSNSDFAQDQAPQAQPPASPSSAASQNQNPGAVSVQARIRARREQRRAQAIRDAYSHLYDTYVGMGYLRFQPGPNLQRVTYYSWDAEFTRFYNPRLGVTVGGRGYYGTPFTPFNPASNGSITRPAVSTYAVMGGPVYRFYLQPKYSISGRVMGGWALGNFSSDTNGFGGQALGLWPDGNTYIVNGGLIGEYNISPGFALRLNGEYVGTGFGSTMQNGFGFTTGFVYRFGKQ